MDNRLNAKFELRVGTLLDPQCSRDAAIPRVAKVAQSLNVLTVTSQHNSVAFLAPAASTVVDLLHLMLVLGLVWSQCFLIFFLFYESSLAWVL